MSVHCGFNFGGNEGFRWILSSKRTLFVDMQLFQAKEDEGPEQLTELPFGFGVATPHLGELEIPSTDEDDE